MFFFIALIVSQRYLYYRDVLVVRLVLPLARVHVRPKYRSYHLSRRRATL